jgi:hemoglobin/transferrin/lactoferrin receptor protein
MRDSCCAPLVALIAAPALVHAAVLDEVLVTATQSASSVFDAPYTAHVLDGARFRDERAVRTLPDALGETPGVLLQRTSLGQTSPFIRGFTGFRTLMLIDGIRLNNAVFREGPNQYWGTIDALMVDRLEVVKGPSSVLNGSDAIGGTVNALTRGPEMLPWPAAPDGKTAPAPAASFAFHPGGYYRYASAEESHIGRADFSLAVSPQVGLYGGFSWKDFGDLRGGDVIGEQARSGYVEADGDLKIMVRPTADVDITAVFQRVEQNNAPRTHSTIFSKSFDGTAVGTDLRREFDQLRELAYVQLEAREPAPWLERVKLSLSWQRQEERQDRLRDTGRRDLSEFSDQTFGALLHFVSPSPLGTLSHGVEYYHDEVDSAARSFNADGSLRGIAPRGPVADDASYDTLGIYLQDEFKIAELVTVIAGVRYSYAHAEADSVDPDLTDALALGALDESFDAFTASLRVRWDVTPGWNFFGGVSQGFRAPNLSDLTSFDIARSGELETPSPDLDSEHYVSFEIGTKARIASLRAQLYAAYYYTLIEDQIVRFPTGRIIDGAPEVNRRNVGDGYIQGVEVGAEWEFAPGFTLWGNFAWTEGELDSFVGSRIEARPASRIAPLTGTLGLRWRSADEKWFLEGAATLARHQDRLSPGDQADTQRIPPGGTRGYQVFTVRGGWQPCAHLRVFAACENISDEDYRSLGSGLNEPGTNFVLGTQVRF